MRYLQYHWGRLCTAQGNYDLGNGSAEVSILFRSPIHAFVAWLNRRLNGDIVPWPARLEDLPQPKTNWHRDGEV